jgi:hypothetical protein
MSDLWWKKWHWDRFFSQDFASSPAVSFHPLLRFTVLSVYFTVDITSK